MGRACDQCFAQWPTILFVPRYQCGGSCIRYLMLHDAAREVRQHPTSQPHLRALFARLAQGFHFLSLKTGAMTQELAIIDDFNEVTRNSWESNIQYDDVNALLIHWADDDLDVKPEVLRFQLLLQEEFRFNSRIYAIPSRNSAAELNWELATFVRQHALQRRTLIIVYYAGHADKVDDRCPPGYSEWRA